MEDTRHTKQKPKSLKVGKTSHSATQTRSDGRGSKKTKKKNVGKLSQNGRVS